MSQFLLIERIKVQDANAASGFTWGFPAITHFLGYVHNLHRKIQANPDLKALSLNGCVVIAHEQNVLSYQSSNTTRFSQTKTAHYMKLVFNREGLRDPAINEEAKMNMTVSLLIPVEGYLGGVKSSFIEFVRNACQVQRLAGGTVLDIGNVSLVDLSNQEQLKRLRHKLLPGFVLQDRSSYLEKQYLSLKEKNKDAELLDAWFDFVALKQVARPACELIDHHLAKQAKHTEHFEPLNEAWLEHKSLPYEKEQIPNQLIAYFQQNKEQIASEILEQWNKYVAPTGTTSANWEYVKKPELGYLVPIMVGYKAITEVLAAGQVEGARDIETDFCFVEAVHSIGEWQGVHRLKEAEEWQNSVWDYSAADENWYLCQQKEQVVEKEVITDDVYTN